MELRAMDCTIWRVRPKEEEDLDERFLAPSIQVLEPLSDEPIAVPGNRILHLTDLHFASEPNSAQHRWDTAPDWAGQFPKSLWLGLLRLLWLSCVRRRRIDVGS